jgi:hypothetical protein
MEPFKSFEEHTYMKDVERDMKAAIISAKQFVCTGYGCVQPNYNSSGYTQSVQVGHNGKWIMMIKRDSFQVLIYDKWEFMYQSKSLYNLILKLINSKLSINDSYELVNQDNEKVDTQLRHKLSSPMQWDIFQVYESNLLEKTILNGRSYNFIGFATVQPSLRPNGELVCIKVAIKGRWILQINKRGVKVLSYTNEYMKENRSVLNKLFEILKSNVYCSKENYFLYNTKKNKQLNTEEWSKLDDELQWNSQTISLSDYFTRSIIKPRKLLEDFEKVLQVK